VKGLIKCQVEGKRQADSEDDRQVIGVPASDGEANVEKSISVHSRAVRWGNDGVGLQFVPKDDPVARKGLNELVNGVSKRELDQFLEQLRKDSE